ncbi:CynX/NimT family MFS transporter [Bacillus dakarensis]|uniref:CynX/NimT family MFS transporter n=1 Tax=Robertmurraya dakarensis TaxID=1926278 RepID=UPI000980B0C0|nr:MFS transporter [Bacillus dakarensis]
MEHNLAQPKIKSWYLFWLAAGIVLVAFNLRPGITSVGPLIGMIQAEVGLAHWSAGLLTSLPLIAFAVVSPVVPKIANKLNNERTLLLGMVVLLAGFCIRSISMTPTLFGGTLLIGIGIAIGNVLLPVVIKDKFPQKFGLMTSVYSTSMGLFASLASGLSVPLAQGLQLGWQGALIVWGIPTVLAIIIWTYLVKNGQNGSSQLKGVKTGDHQMWRSPLAWQVALYMGFQSFMFYVTVAWLPQILHDQGLSIETAGWMLSFTQLIGLPAGFIAPVLAGRMRSQQWIAAVLGSCSLIGYLGLWFGSTYSILVISIIFIGIGLGGTFPLALAFLGMRSRNAKQASELSGMAQSIGYILAAAGPLLIGTLYDVTHVWDIPILTLIIVSIIVTLFGISAGRDRFV